jgi:trimeric autotransporter adhesin
MLMKKLLLSFFLLTTIIAKAQIITTIAGTGTYGYSGDGGQATNAKIASPGGMCFDIAGNLIFADYGNSRIRKISASTGVITTIAGTGASAYSGDGGLAINATLRTPSDVIIDNAGNLYIADYQNYRIRKVNAVTGIITTIAGNGSQGDSGDNMLATTVPVKASSLCLDAAQENLYLNDDYRIRKINLSTGILTTVAGNNYSGFSGDGGLARTALLGIPTDLFLDAANNIYIADMGNNRIRKIDGVTKIITTIAGSTSGFSGDGGPATAAKLWYPSDVTVDNAGNIYISDYLNNRIRFVSQSTGIITTIAGTGAAGYSGDGGPATSAAIRSPSTVIIGANNNILFSDQDNDRIRKISATTLLQGNDLSFEIAPNPAKTDTRLLFQKNTTDGVISIIDEKGKTLYSTTFNGSEYLLNTSELLPGVHYIRVSAGNATSLKRIVITK